jgi:exopolysaccharide biosynthesis polyprenyl glycosylphosphotransferase
MLKRRNEQIQFLVRLADVLLAVIAFFGAYGLRSSVFFANDWQIGPIDSLTWLLAASLVLHLILYPFFGFYESLRLKRIQDILGMVFKCLLFEFFILGSLVFFFQAKTTSRYFFVLFIGINYALILLEKIGARVFLSSVRKRGFNYRQILIVGTGKNASQVIAALKRNRHWGYVPCGLMRDAAGDPAVTSVDGVPVLGALSELESVLARTPVDEVFFGLDRIDAQEVASDVLLCERLGMPARFSLGMFELARSKVTFSNLDHLPVITFYTTLMTPMESLIKRIMDVCVSLIGLALTAVLYPWIAYRIRKESPGPVIFKQVRVGENGRRFKCYKFRTMVLDAEARKQELQAANAMQGPIFKIENDPRIFPFGAFLRRSSLDELPQFLNIFRGDMSVVGTRPPTPDEVGQYQVHFKRRLSIRPGLTGLWQVSGRNQIRNFEDVLALDLQYIDNWSIWLDIRIIFKTIWVALFHRGAY